ncbi:unnamed protein product [Rotaria sp. Silwood1]|nr:unnamed protein product [Rotaria sp. Silwood1]CAF1389347.1 unnamed protein product [Rotaria sp. Silwood1]CAF3591075.1 unnamed protein product [Rotaria sp. Silwood1]CAF3609342.1 unnamed protein product [Rotaria sp. Silwood1]CAF4650034.1 unnamed protein product [Rotaria sp. Silwood1]
MEDDEDDFFAYQTAKSLNNKRTQLKQFLQAPVTSQQLSSSSNSDSDSENDLISIKKTKSKSVDIPTQSIIIQTETIKTKDVVKNEIDAIVTSCFTSTNKEVKRKIKLGKRTAADDQEYENEDEYLTYFLDQSRNRSRNRNISRAQMNLLNKSQLEEDDEKVTRETAAYNRLDAVLRVTKPLCEKQIESIDYDEDDDDEEENEPIKTNISNGIDVIDPVETLSFDTITLKIDHSDGRQLTLSLPLSTTLKNLYDQVAKRLSLPSIYLVYNNQTLKLDDNNQSMTLKQLNFSSDNIQLLESYPLVRKLKIFIQTSSSSSGRRSSFIPKREYKMLDTDRFEIIFETYKHDVKSTNIRFEFDGYTLHPHATPSDYDMTDGEILDAFILSTSSNTNKQNNQTKTKKTKEIIFDDDSDN